MQMKKGFLKFIKNCIMKTKLKHYMERIQRRLYEKGFDKIKENSWIVEERRDTIDTLFKRR